MNSLNNSTFSDLLIEPCYSEIKSRREVDISTQLHPKVKLELPIISANMKTVTGPAMAAMLAKNGGLGVLHRFGGDIDSQIAGFKETQKLVDTKHISNIGASLGVKEDDRELFKELWNCGAKIFCIDVAHGHHVLVKELLEFINNTLSTEDRKDCCIIAGNVATYQATLDITNWGADVIKVGIGPGSACITRANTGVGVPQLHAIAEARRAVNENNLKIKLIADGGVVRTGDISKALVIADAVMLGGMLSGTFETPGDIYKDVEGKYYKVYAGSASGHNKQSSGQVVEYIEGIAKQIPLKGSVEQILREIREGVQSAFSYVNARTLDEFHKKAKLIPLSIGSMAESKFL